MRYKIRFLTSKKDLAYTKSFLVGEGGFEPPKSLTTDLQSVPFGRSGTLPYSVKMRGAGGRTRTPDLLITNQLLYQLSYTSALNAQLLYHKQAGLSTPFCDIFYFFKSGLSPCDNQFFFTVSKFILYAVPV